MSDESGNEGNGVRELIRQRILATSENEEEHPDEELNDEEYYQQMVVEPAAAAAAAKASTNVRRRGGSTKAAKASSSAKSKAALKKKTKTSNKKAKANSSSALAPTNGPPPSNTTSTVALVTNKKDPSTGKKRKMLLSEDEEEEEEEDSPMPKKAKFMRTREEDYKCCWHFRSLDQRSFPAKTDLGPLINCDSCEKVQFHDKCLRYAQRKRGLPYTSDSVCPMCLPGYPEKKPCDFGDECTFHHDEKQWNSPMTVETCKAAKTSDYELFDCRGVTSGAANALYMPSVHIIWNRVINGLNPARLGAFHAIQTIQII